MRRSTPCSESWICTGIAILVIGAFWTLPPAQGQGVRATESTPREVEAALSLTRAERVAVQRGLAALTFDVGPLDGIFGRRTREAISRWQASTGRLPTGYLDVQGAETLLTAGRRTPAQKSAGRLRILEYRAKIAATERLDDRRRATALLAIALEQSAAGDTREALDTAARIEGAYLRSHALVSISEHRANAGDARGALRTLAAALAAARAEPDPSHRARALARTAEARAAINGIGTSPRPRESPGDPPAAPSGFNQ